MAVYGDVDRRLIAIHEAAHVVIRFRVGKTLSGPYSVEYASFEPGRERTQVFRPYTHQYVRRINSTYARRRFITDMATVTEGPLADVCLVSQTQSFMPLAHPVCATPTSNFGEPAFAVRFALARPGETVDDFQLRINSRGEWGQTRYGRDKVELVLTAESVERLVGLLSRPIELRD